MIQMKSAALGLVVLAFAGGAAFTAGATAKDDGMHKMSARHMKMMKSCQTMSHDLMMKNKGCMKMMKMHPDMMNADGSMKPDGMMKK